MGSNEGPVVRKRERSARYPGVPLADSLDLCRFVQDRGLDGLSAADVATALGYKNIKTNTFSARLSAARQFGLLRLRDEGYFLTPLAHAILHPVNPAELPRLLRRAFESPPLYADLVKRFGGRRLPDPAILGNVLYHDYDIIATAKQAAVEAFLESARFAGALGEDAILLPPEEGAPPLGLAATAPDDAPSPARRTPAPVAVPEPPRAGPASPSIPPPPIPPRAVSAQAPPRDPTPAPRLDAPAGAPTREPRHRPPEPGVVRLELPLWGADEGKRVLARVPERMTRASYERLLQALALHVRIVDGE